MARPKGVKESKPRKQRAFPASEKLIGNKYHYLTVLELIKIPGRRVAKLRVLCDCGVEKLIDAYDITCGKTKSCGCYHKREVTERQIKADNKSSKRRLYNSYRFGARDRDKGFNLTEDQVYEIANQNCFYCDKSPEKVYKTVGGEIKVSGIDRVDNSIGYEYDNCVPCCKDCNLAKHATTVQIIKKAYEFLMKKEENEDL